MQDLPSSIFQANEWPTQPLTEQNAITNALMISLFSDLRVSPLSQSEKYYRGYWADSLDPKRIPLGSKLWTLSNQPLNDETLESAIQLTYEALSPLIFDEIISEFTADGAISKGRINLFIRVTAKEETFSYQLDLFRGLYALI